MEHGAGGHGALWLSVVTAVTSTPVRSARPERRRWVEWGLLSAVILALMLLFLHEGRKVQGQAELAAIQSTLGALRTAAILQDLQARASGRPAASGGTMANPFDLLRSRPGNYLGALDAAQALAARPGSWMFDTDCVCVTYVPLETRWLDTPAGASALRFRVRSGAGPLVLDAIEPYVWQGRAVR